jgi:3-hydroxyanthranilate 3,4-dioxygenase
VSALAPINLSAWVAEHRHLLKPPVGNKPIWDGDFLVMVVGGPNQRADYHINPGGELFFQVEGDIVLKIIKDGEPRDVSIRNPSRKRKRRWKSVACPSGSDCC